MLLTGVAVQERLEGGQQEHEQRHPLPPTERLEFVTERGRQGEGLRRAAVVLRRRALQLKR